jgi:hypothetical protein
MVVDLFFKDEFKRFYKRVERLQSFLRILERENRLEHYIELRKHFNVLKKLFNELFQLYEKELLKIEKFPSSKEKEELKEISLAIKNDLLSMEGWVDSALLHIEEILKIRIPVRVEEQKYKLMKIIRILAIILVNLEKKAIDSVRIEESWNRHIKEEHRKSISKIKIKGRLKCGWPLENIRNVVIELGGEVVPNVGRHPYKIVFPGVRPIPLGKSTPPLALVDEINSITKIGTKRLILSFKKGELL